MTRHARVAAAALSTALLLFTLGCGNTPGRPVISGKVTYLGNPLTSGDISFVPADSGETVSAAIQPDGTYTLDGAKFDQGIPPGTYQVRIAAYQGAAEMSENASLQPVIPLRYFDAKTSTLVANVDAAVRQTFDFDLKE